jgi:ABC-type glycerol-3-phosphate transport system permease component
MAKKMESTKQIGLKITHFGALTVFAVFASLPFLWMLITTFKQDADLYNRTYNPFIFNLAPTLEHLQYLFNETLFLRWLLNTAMVGIAVVAITLILAIPAGYSLVRLGGRWGERLGIAIFLTYLVAPTILFIPMSRVNIPNLPGSPDDFVYPHVTSGRKTGPAGFFVVVGGGFSIFYRAIRHLAFDGVFQSHPPGSGGSSHD